MKEEEERKEKRFVSRLSSRRQAWAAFEQNCKQVRVFSVPVSLTATMRGQLPPQGGWYRVYAQSLQVAMG
ncbi:hypothetical protein PISMIDRAFT_356584 [Pisolithus microcarpus 441]|uniref:Unplaced genomic scaffold scaffold_26, whole genome shotgun sequence n=1 Tax=Pisolithus microcarpus 441 TaxID=765257 RepID=A0A0C9YJU7_9AGAM|nr:hypothetical protein PISMIDRAFT_356584 [Pisolithus microcarpus 441]